ncbi:MAG: phosphatidylglycerophosphatase A [Opitutus sp.]
MRLPQPHWPQLLPTRTIVNVATIGPLGRRTKAPGTWGSLAGLLYFTVAFAGLGPVGNVLLSALGAWLAVGFCGEAETRLGRSDPGEIVLDEFIAMPLCFVGWQWLPGAWPNWAVFLAGFGLFRLYDIVKPFGIGRLQRLPGGWGVVADDVAAALAACATLHVAAALWP